ncbi:aldo/keto reductase [Psychrobacillus vulpis]|nr:aldo/keto reductase [Psychrobacillus vulpis]
MIKGFATKIGTSLYTKKHEIPNRKTPWFTTSRIALGTHLGDMNEKDSELYRESIEFCLENGINLIDTAINYRGMRSERDVGFVLEKLISKKGSIKREEIVISTKGGIIPGDIEANLFPQDYLENVLLENNVIKKSDLNIVDHLRHVLTPSYYQFAIEQSRKHLNLETIDIYYIHNPEISMKVLGPEIFYRQLRNLFSFLEEEVENQKIMFYGLATWHGLIYEPNESGYISLEKVVEVAKSIAGENNHFKFIQFPLNRQMDQGVTRKNQQVKHSYFSVINAARQLDLEVTTSAPFNLGKKFEEENNPAQLLTQIMETRGITSTMIGMKRVQHVVQNIEVIKNLSF